VFEHNSPEPAEILSEAGRGGKRSYVLPRGRMDNLVDMCRHACFTRTMGSSAIGRSGSHRRRIRCVRKLA
jgi:hypothetical protein